MMGGTIDVRSERGVGTSFTMEIPIYSGAICALPAPKMLGVAA